jgi:DNA-binding MarR family transcriptional regulator
LKTPNTSKPDAGWALPLTVTRPILSPGKSDRAFRSLLYGFFTVATRLETIRRLLGARMGVTGPQYSIVIAIAELEGSSGVSVGRVADYLHVAPTFITAESGKLVRRGYIEKRSDPADRRISRLRITHKGRSALEALLPLLRQVNDACFDLESGEQFQTLCRAFDCMLDGSRRALALLDRGSGERDVRHTARAPGVAR